MAISAETPMQRQYNQIKAKHKDAILFFRLGDFYETFNEDAETLSKVLGVTLTGRGKDENRIPLAGIPYHALDNYLPKLVKAGYKVAIAEQMNEAGQGKIVEREIVKIHTPGTFVEDNISKASTNYIACINVVKQKQQQQFDLAYLDVATGDFYVKTFDNLVELRNELFKINPSEVLLSENNKSIVVSLGNLRFEFLYPSDFNSDSSYDILIRHFNTLNLKGFGIDKDDSLIIPAGALLKYVKSNQRTEVKHIVSIQRVADKGYMNLDPTTLSSLEILNPIRYENDSATLFSHLNKCQTNMGQRLLREWLVRPLIDKDQIEFRLNQVEVFFKDRKLASALNQILAEILDISRILGKIGTGSINGRDLLGLEESLSLVNKIHGLLSGSNYKNINKDLVESLDNQKYSEVVQIINQSINPECPGRIEDGRIIKDGFDAEVDRLRAITTQGKDYLAELQQRERERTNILSLKIKYNKVFGYYIEISKSNLDKVPSDYIRKQTLVNAERYITPELKEYEDQVLTAESKLIERELELFRQVVGKVSEYIAQLQNVSRAIAELDAYVDLANVAFAYKYIRPHFNDSKIIKIDNGRHPVVEVIRKEKYIPNDLEMNDKTDIIILTGPNMSGKSTYIRQIALTQLLAQIGSYVPATNAELFIVDRIFTRVGASDNLAAGESTFMVEMTETANILNNATDRSLIILDEIGRGTSTYDGVAIAWSIVEYICKNIKAKTLFATHYHELTKMSNRFDNIQNFHVQVMESGNDVIFTHHIKNGGVSKSYGIHVAQMAGVPENVVERAKSVLQNIEQSNKSTTRKIKNTPTKSLEEPIQIGLF